MEGARILGWGWCDYCCCYSLHFTSKNQTVAKIIFHGYTVQILDKGDRNSADLVELLVSRGGGSVRSGSGLSPEGCNFSRFLKSGFEWLNMFQLFYYDAVREDFTKKSPDHLFQAFYRCPKSPGSVRGYIRASWFWKKS